MSSVAPTAEKTNDKNARARIRSVDLLRGAVMVLMAIDHVRVYSGVPPGGPSAGVFFTRWVTHFCAPAFVFFAGTSAFLYGRRPRTKAELARYLLTRGLLLVLLELTLIKFSWTFNVDYGFILAGVIWMLGWCMVLMAALIWLRPVTVGVIGLLIIFFQPVFQFVPGILPASLRESVGRAWEFIYPSGIETWEGISILYVLVPWIGVMAAGYGFGAILVMEPARRNRICLRIGLAAIAIFIVAAGIIAWRQPSGDDAPPLVFQLLNQRKYPASQLFLLMTLGPVIALVPFAETARGWLANVLSTFGKVPMFYYLLHIPVIHLSAILVNELKDIGGYSQWYASAPYVWMPPEHKWTLLLLYLVFLIDVILLYFVCRWYEKYKFAHPGNKWLRYL